MEVKDVTIEVRDANLDVQGRILPEFWTDILLNPVANGLGHWSITLPAEHDLVPLLRTPGSGIRVTTPGRIISGFMDTATNNADGDDPESTWTFEGTTDEAILDDPLCYPTPGVADPALQVDEFNVRTGAAETIIHEYIVANIGSAAPLVRRNPYVTLGANGARGGAQTYSAKWDVLLEAIQKIATIAGLGFRVTQVAGNLQFDCYVPTDRSDTIRMNIWNNTVDNTKYSFGAPKLTHAIVGGQGDGPYRLIIERTTADSLAAASTWHRRRERFVDARSADNTTELQLAGDKELLENGISLAAVAVTPSDDLTMVYGIDWDLGDKVTVEVGGQDVKAVVTEIIILINKDGVRVGAKVGDPTGFDFESIMANEVLTLRQRIADLERVVSTDPLNVRTRNAQIDPEYSSGLARVIFEGESLLTATGYGWINTYIPIAGDLVSLQYSDGQWLITGARKYTPKYLSPIQLPLNTAGGWRTYDNVPGDPAYATTTPVVNQLSPITVTKSTTGWVMVAGLAYHVGANTAGAVIATLPTAFRPPHPMTFPAFTSGASGRTVTVNTDGTIVANFAEAATSWWSLGNIQFNLDVVMTPIALPLSNAWVPFGGSKRVPSWGKDSLGLAFAAGSMKSGSLTNSSAIAPIPAGFRPIPLPGQGNYHEATASFASSATGAGTYIIGNTTGLTGHVANTMEIVFGPSATEWNLDGMIWEEATAGMVWETPAPFRNSWSTYDSSWNGAAYCKRADGTVILRGLIKGGGINSAIMTLPEGYRPARYILRSALSVSSSARVDIRPNGDVVFVSGTNTWCSLDGIMFAAAQ